MISKNKIHFVGNSMIDSLIKISKTIENNDRIEIRPSQIDLAKEINKIGLYESRINLHPEVQATIHIEVVKEDDKS